MLDLKFIRENRDLVDANARRRGSSVTVDEIIKLDDRRLDVLRQVEALRAERNKLSNPTQGSRPREEDIKRGKEIKRELSHLESELSLLESQVKEKMSWLPNLLDEDVPDGQDDSDSLEVATWGQPKDFGFEPKDHQELGESLDIIDIKRSANVSGSGFYYLKGDGAQLALALHYWAIKVLVARGYVPFLTPVVAKERTLFGTGYLPFGGEDIYRVEGEEFGLIGTSEQTLVGYHADEVIDLSAGPLRYTAFSPCFRKEAGSYGRDTRGIFRAHQFHKVEQIVFCKPEESVKYHQECQENEEFFLRELDIPYRVVNVCVGDMAAPGFKKYDIEAWFPGQGRYREVTSNTNLTDFQTRRLSIRYREGSQLILPHTISATGVTDRLLAAIIENYQQEDGSIAIPEVLRPLVGKDLIVPLSSG